MTRPASLAGAVPLAASPTLATTAALPAEAHTARVHDGCTKVNKTCSHIVGARRVHDSTSGDPVAHVKGSDRICRKAERHYSVLDRDLAGLACEKA